jgi:hypothetical protein
MTNVEIADKLREVADLLALEEASPYRVAAYRRAADSLEQLAEPVEQSGVLIPDVDRALHAAITELTRTGRLALLDRLRGTADPKRLFRGVPGIGPRRAQAIRAALAEMLGRPVIHCPEPDVSLLLDVDREYRSRPDLPRIAPRDLNAAPVLHTQRGDWRVTALYSNSANAHRLGRTRDWVILYFTDGTHAERQCTVVTETHGILEGRRVVRGRERDCLHLYQPDWREGGNHVS